MASSSNDAQNINVDRAPVIEGDDEYECIKIDGVLSPDPISYILPTPQPPPPAEARPSEQQRQQHERRKKRDLTASRILETKTFTFQLLRCQAENQYALTMQEVDTQNKTFYVLLPHEKKGKRKMEAKETILGQRIILPIIGEICPNMDNKYQLSLQERLEGKWTMEVRERTGTLKTEKFYCHQRVNKTFRSLSDVATFIVYNVIY